MFCPAPSPPPSNWKVEVGRWDTSSPTVVQQRNTRIQLFSSLLTKSSVHFPSLSVRERGEEGNLRPVGFFNRFNLLFSILFLLPPSQKGPPSGSPRLNGPDNGSLYRYFTATFFPTVYTILSLLGENGSRRSGTRGTGDVEIASRSFSSSPFFLSLSRLIYDQLELAAFCFSPRISPKQSSLSIIFLRQSCESVPSEDDTRCHFYSKVIVKCANKFLSPFLNF